jgi:isocitrate dehydrogenase
MSYVASSREPIVILHGDEMAQVAFDLIVKRFVKAYVDMPLAEHDLSAKNRLRTNGDVVACAIEDLKRHKIGVKNAGVTVTSEQKERLLKELEAEGEAPSGRLAPLATQSPNGAIRKGVGGNISREDIPFRHILKRTPEWIGRDIRVLAPAGGGVRFGHACVAPESGTVRLELSSGSGGTEILHSRSANAGDPLMLAAADKAEIASWATHLFSLGLEERTDVYVGFKDTVLPGYDGVIKEIVDGVFKQNFARRYEAAGIACRYGLIDAQAATMIVTPPERAIWGIADNATGRSFAALIEELKTSGFPDRGQTMSVSRMSAGGGDQYGSYNAPAPSDGVASLTLNGKPLHSVSVTAGSPLMLMGNDRPAVAAWAKQTFRDAAHAGEEIYFALDEGGSAYDRAFADSVREVYKDLLRCSPKQPPFMICEPAFLLKKMICDPPKKARYACRNLDGDVFSDVTAAYSGSLAMASSSIIGENGVCLYEAPHGTAPDLYKRYVESGGKEANFNPSALIYAVGEALRKRGECDRNPAVSRYGEALCKALTETADAGVVTADVAGCLRPGIPLKRVDLYGFLDAVEERLRGQGLCAAA